MRKVFYHRNSVLKTSVVTLNKRWLYYPFFQAFFLHGNSKSSWLIGETFCFVSKSNPLFPFLILFYVKKKKNCFEVNLQPTDKKLKLFFLRKEKVKLKPTQITQWECYVHVWYRSGLDKIIVHSLGKNLSLTFNKYKA